MLQRFQVFILILLASFFMLLVSVMMMPKKISPEVSKMFSSFNGETVVFLTGDVMLGRSVLTKSEKVGDYRYPFLKVVDILKTGDIVFSNLENPFVSDCPRTDSGMIFCSDPRMVEGLKYSNISVVTLANNHMTNYGQKGVVETKKVLTDNKVDYVGDGNLVVRNIKGIKYGFLGFNYVSSKPTNFDLEMIKKAKETCDVLIVSIHWGAEYQSKAGKTQRDIAKTIIGAGADIIAGHHPHWVQDIEYINSKPVYYSLGNLVFDQMWSEETKKGLVMKLTFKDGKLLKEEQLPIFISSLGQPEFVIK